MSLHPQGGVGLPVTSILVAKEIEGMLAEMVCGMGGGIPASQYDQVGRQRRRSPHESNMCWDHIAI